MELRSAVNSPSIIALTRLIIQLTPLLTAPIVARELGPEGRGFYAACFAAMTLTPVALGLGLPLVTRRRSANHDPASTMRSVYRIIPILIPCAVGIGYFIKQALIPGISTLSGHIFLVGMGCSIFFL